MLTGDQCFTHLKQLADGTDPNALALAERFIADFLADASSDPREAAAALGHLQGRIVRGTAPSPTRADLLDLMGDWIGRLLEQDAERR